MHTNSSMSVKKLRRHAKAVLREAALAPVAILSDDDLDDYLMSSEAFKTMNKKLDDIEGGERIRRLSAGKPEKFFAEEL